MLMNPPIHLLQRISGDPNVEAFQGSFAHIRREVCNYLGEAGFDFAKFRNILDMGCGVGRFLFAFQPELAPGQRLFGCEVHEECARWCRENIDFATVVHNPIHPPLPFPEQFDLVYALSVFTHLRLDLQFEWAWEIYRVLRPGGVFFLTLHGPQFFHALYKPLCDRRPRVKRGGLRARLFPSFYNPLCDRAAHNGEIYSVGNDGLFAYLSYRGKDGDEGQIEVAAAHTPSCVEEIFSAFRIAKRIPQSLMAGGQDVYVLQKPLDAKPLALPQNVQQSVVHERLRQSPDGGIELKFTLEGQKTFSVYPCAMPNGIYPVECQIRVTAGQQVVLDEKRAINNNRVFGETHYTPLHVPLPQLAGPVSIHLRDIAPAATGNTDINWSFPHCR